MATGTGEPKLPWLKNRDLRLRPESKSMPSDTTILRENFCTSNVDGYQTLFKHR